MTWLRICLSMARHPKTRAGNSRQLLGQLPIAKSRRAAMSPPVTTTSLPTPSTPPSPQTINRYLHCSTPVKTRSHLIKKPRIILNDIEPSKTLNPTAQKLLDNQTLTWVPLHLGKSELSLPLTFPTGQTFRWKQTGPLQYTGVVGSHLVSLKHLGDGDVAYCLHHTNCADSARLALLDFLNMGICLSDMWEAFSASDSRFADLAQHLGGARVLRQDPLECLIQFLCSSNNNIRRITGMVNFMSSLGKYLGSVAGFEFHEFPSLERLLRLSEGELRKAGFGYRAKYIIGTVNALQSKPGGGVEWLMSLRGLDLSEVVDALSTLPGVGPKVAACIALFSLDQHHAIPVDTHVWQIATRYLIPELAGARLTPKLCSCVADAFVSKYGKYAGWAQTLLFIAELPLQKALLPSSFQKTREKRSARRKSGKTGRDQ